MASSDAVTATPDESRILVYQMEIPIRWGDMDAMGHVNNTVYFRYMEQARISWFDAMQLRPDPLGEGPLIINAACTFNRQLEYPGTVLARRTSSPVSRWMVRSERRPAANPARIRITST